MNKKLSLPYLVDKITDENKPEEFNPKIHLDEWDAIVYERSSEKIYKQSTRKKDTTK